VNSRLMYVSASIVLIMLGVMGIRSIPVQADDSSQAALEALGQALFFDVNLSLNRTQSCSSCHNPAYAFTDNGLAASLGADGVSLGDRNTPTLSYVGLIPAFHHNAAGEPVGGFFWDGRALNLAAQVAGPVLDITEMGMPDLDTVVARVRENQAYNEALQNIFGDEVFASAELVFAALSQAIARFQTSEFFAPFDSRYDRYLRGEYRATPQEELGMALFFSPPFTNCAECHQAKPLPRTQGEVFTNHQYENIGVPANRKLQARNGREPQYVDTGLLNNPLALMSGHTQPGELQGRFRVPTLRNVAITGPYMHNGVFKDLRTVLLFYNKFHPGGGTSQINPETGETWGAAEVPDTVALEKLQATLPLQERHIDALLAFLSMLTDQRYEHLLD
jgi:cytochrome c peroxidase